MRIKIYLFIIFLTVAFFGVKNLKYLYDFGKETPRISKSGLFLKCNERNTNYQNTRYIVLNKNLLGEYNKLFSIKITESYVLIWESEEFKISDDRSEYIASARDRSGYKSNYITISFSLNRNNFQLVKTRKDHLPRNSDYRWASSSEFYTCNITKDDVFNNLKIGLINAKKFNIEKEKQKKKLQEETESKTKI